jgi:hypothetical protein
MFGFGKLKNKPQERYAYDLEVTEKLIDLPDAPSITEDEIILMRREQKKAKELGGGINKTVLVELQEDGGAVFKPDKRERVFKAEFAAYLVDKFIGLNLVPSTVIRNIGEEKGSVQRFIPDAKTGASSSVDEITSSYSSELNKMVLLDVIIWNGDRHDENFITNKDKKFFAIDHGFAFKSRGYDIGMEYLDPHTLQRMNVGTFISPGIRIPSETMENLRKIDSPSSSRLDSLNSILKELVGEYNAEACIKRIKFLIKSLNENNGTLPPGLEVDFNPEL